jgi:hypothetical protein
VATAGGGLYELYPGGAGRNPALLFRASCAITSRLSYARFKRIRRLQAQ